MSIIKRKRKNRTAYEAVLYIRGKRVASKTFEKKSQAKAWEEERKQTLSLQGTLQQRRQEKIKSLRFCDCVQKYKNEWLLKLARSSQETGHDFIIRYLEPSPLWRVPMLELGEEAIDLWMEWLLKHSSTKGRMRFSFRAELKYLTAILNWYKNYYDALFCVPIVKRHRERAIYKKIKARRVDYFARPEEINRWIAKLQEHKNPLYWRLATLMIFTGVRVGEACGLMWDSIDLQRGIAYIRRTVGWARYPREPFIQESTKTQGSARAIALGQNLVAMLMEMQEEIQKDVLFSKVPLVFHCQGKPLKYRSIQNVFDRAFKACELPWRGTHICRHTFATIALMTSKDLSSVQAALGHTDQKITQKYAKVAALLSSKLADKVEAAIQTEAQKARIEHDVQDTN